MKILESLWDMLPSPYRTGFIAAVIYVVWVGIGFYLEEHLHYYPHDLLYLTLLFVIHWPAYFHNLIYEALSHRAYATGTWQPLRDVGYHYIGYIGPGIVFTIIGMLLGLTENTPQKEAKRRRTSDDRTSAFEVLYSLRVSYR
jgi:hypothetical protein